MAVEECRVRGALAVILRCGRAVGVAPVMLTRAADGSGGYRAAYCRASALYGYVLSSLLIISALSSDLLSFVAARSGANRKGDLSRLPQASSVLVVYGTSSMAAQRLVLNMFGYLATLNEMNTKANIMSREKKRSILTVFIVTVYCFLQTWNFFSKFSKDYGFDIILFCFNCFDNIKYVMLQFMMIQVALLYFEVHKALEVISDDLQQLIEPESDMAEAKCRLRDANRRYITVCDVIVQINKDTGFFCIIVFIFNIFTLMDTTTFIAVHFITKGYKNADWIYVLRYSIWMVFETLRPLIFVEPFQQIENERTKIKCIVAQMMYSWTRRGEQLCEELGRAARQLRSSGTAVAPMGMLRHSRALVITIYSVVMTYAIVELQFKIYNLTEDLPMNNSTTFSFTPSGPESTSN